MEDVVSSFPLFNLPNNSLKCALQNMELFHLCSLSILSKRSKKLVKSLNLKDYQINVILGDSIRIDIVHQPSQDRPIFMLLRMDETGNIFAPDFLRACYHRENNIEYCKWKKQGFEMKEWIDHFLSILNISKVYGLFFGERTPLDIEDIHKAISEVTEIHIDNEYPVSYIQKVVQTFVTVKKLTIFWIKLGVLKHFHTNICQNFDVLALHSFTHELPRWGLNDLLVMNSQSIEIFYSNLTEKDVNKFLKHWMNGFNSRMKHFEIHFERNKIINNAIIFNGLSHKVNSKNQERQFKMLENNSEGFKTVTVKGGYDIQRKDGTKATIIFHKYQVTSKIELFVWH